MVHLRRVLLLSALMTVCMGIPVVYAQDAPKEELSGFDLRVKNWGLECRQKIIAQFELLLTSGKLTTGQLFDTFYIPVPNSDPPRYSTQYDKLSDEVVQNILDEYLAKSNRLVYVVIVDRNGYLPTHNTKFQQPLTGDSAEDLKNNRAKRIFNDRTGIAAAKNKKPYLLQSYARDTGEKMHDLSVPIFIQGRHWGAVRIGYK